MAVATSARRITPARAAPYLAGALAILAWGALWVWGRSPHARFLGHEDVAHASAAQMPLFVAGWVLMIVAMMLPTSLPLVALFARMMSRRRDGARLVALLIGGYLAAWGAFGVVAHAGDWLVHAVVGHSAWLGARPWAIPATMLVAGGAYHLTPLERLCLDRCRSPRSFVLRHWHGRNEARSAFTIGAHHGIFCVGCCWPLMLVMFGVGAGSLGWMFALGVVMAVEKNHPWGRRLVTPVGAALLTAGGVLALWGAAQ